MDESSLQPSSIWRKFAISSYNSLGDGWIEHCTGYITTDYEAQQNPIDEGTEARGEAKDWEEMLQVATERCVSPFEIDDVYDNLVSEAPPKMKGKSASHFHARMYLKWILCLGLFS